MVNAVIAVSLGAMTLSSCIGSFCLTNNVLDWNKRATDNKFVNELISSSSVQPTQYVLLQTCSCSTLSSSGQAKR